MGLSVASCWSIVGCFPEFVFQFDVAQVIVGLRNQVINNFFSTWACADGFNNNNNNKLLS